MKVPILIFAIASCIFLTSCNSTGQASRAVCLGECGDGFCSDCENCKNCQEDCCVEKCTDSDGGINDAVSGEVNGFHNKNFYKTDKCLNKYILEEYSCGGSNHKVPTNTRIDCSKKGLICSRQACN